MITDPKVLQSQVRQQRENVRVWEEGLERERAKLQDMRRQLSEAQQIADVHGVSLDDGKD